MAAEEGQRIFLDNVKLDTNLLARLFRELVKLEPLHETVLLLHGLPSIHLEESL